ncbi:MAG: formyltransferase family protein [Bdellovibrionota bacterium]
MNSNKKIAVLASGQGSNFESLAQNFPNSICALICNVEGAQVLELAKKYEVPSFLIPHKNFKTRAEHEKEIIAVLSQFKELKLIVLAGYMRVLTKTFFLEYSNSMPKIINLHPAHLEQYKGAHAYEYAVANKYPRWGLSIHEVTEELDSGQLLNSTEFTIYPQESAHELKNRIKYLEHKLLVETIKNIL